MKTEIDIKPDIITWAIARAGYELQEFAAKFPKVLDWIADKKKPTVKQLEKFSRKVIYPLAIFSCPNHL